MTRATSHRMTNSAKATQRHVRTRPHATSCTHNLFHAGRSSPSCASTTASNHCYGPSSASASHHSCRPKLADRRAPRGRLHYTFTTVAAFRTSRQQDLSPGYTRPTRTTAQSSRPIARAPDSSWPPPPSATLPLAPSCPLPPSASGISSSRDEPFVHATSVSLPKATAHRH